MIKQLQEYQLALTEGLDKNRLAITQGFDKMDEVKKWDLQQLPGYEAIEEDKESEATEEPEEFSDAEKSIIYKISNRDLNKLLDDDIYPDDDHLVHMNKIDFEKIYRESPNREKYLIKINKFTGETKVINKPINFPYGESDMDKYLMNKGSIDLLQSYGLELPSHYKDNSLKELEEALEKSQAISSKYKDKIKKCCKL